MRTTRSKENEAQSEEMPQEKCHTDQNIDIRGDDDDTMDMDIGEEVNGEEDTAETELDDEPGP